MGEPFPYAAVAPPLRPELDQQLGFPTGVLPGERFRKPWHYGVGPGTNGLGQPMRSLGDPGVQKSHQGLLLGSEMEVVRPFAASRGVSDIFDRRSFVSLMGKCLPCRCQKLATGALGAQLLRGTWRYHGLRG